MIYACEDCGFLFCRTGEVKECPSCEKGYVRMANDEEIQRLETLLEQDKKSLRYDDKRSI